MDQLYSKSLKEKLLAMQNRRKPKVYKEEPKSMFDQLPPELKKHILQFINDPIDMISASEVSKQWEEMMNQYHFYKIIATKFCWRRLKFHVASKFLLKCKHLQIFDCTHINWKSASVQDISYFADQFYNKLRNIKEFKRVDKREYLHIQEYLQDLNYYNRGDCSQIERFELFTMDKFTSHLQYMSTLEKYLDFKLKKLRLEYHTDAVYYGSKIRGLESSIEDIEIITLHPEYDFWQNYTLDVLASICGAEICSKFRDPGSRNKSNNEYYETSYVEDTKESGIVLSNFLSRLVSIRASMNERFLYYLKKGGHGKLREFYQTLPTSLNLDILESIGAQLTHLSLAFTYWTEDALPHLERYFRNDSGNLRYLKITQKVDSQIVTFISHHCINLEVLIIPYIGSMMRGNPNWNNFIRDTFEAGGFRNLRKLCIQGKEMTTQDMQRIHQRRPRVWIIQGAACYSAFSDGVIR